MEKDESWVRFLIFDTVSQVNKNNVPTNICKERIIKNLPNFSCVRFKIYFKQSNNCVACLKVK